VDTGEEGNGAMSVEDVSASGSLTVMIDVFDDDWDLP